MLLLRIPLLRSILSLLVVITRTPVKIYQPVTYIFLILLAIIPQLIGHSSLNWALKYLSTTYVSIAQMGEPIGSTILAIFIFQEIPSAIKILGAVFDPGWNFHCFQKFDFNVELDYVVNLLLTFCCTFDSCV